VRLLLFCHAPLLGKARVLRNRIASAPRTIRKP
jgi:hypothetical protein